jgi:hypothetical protein
MTSFTVTKEQLQRAKDRFDFKELNGSITKGEGNIAGALGEIVTIDYLKSLGRFVEDESTYDYDFKSNGFKIDVKTKRQNYPPKENYRVAVSSWNTRQKCDYYIFCTTLYDYSKVYINGYFEKKNFFLESILLKKGDNDINGFVAKYDCYIMENKNLNKI